MKWNLLLRRDDVALLQSESDTQYAVVYGYDPTQPENQQWRCGDYFEYWEDKEYKVECLQVALETFRVKTEREYISRFRLAELTTRFKDCCEEEEWYENVIDDMEDYKKEFFGICQEEDTDKASDNIDMTAVDEIMWKAIQQAAYEEQCCEHQESSNEDYFEGLNDYLDGTMNV